MLPPTVLTDRFKGSFSTAFAVPLHYFIYYNICKTSRQGEKFENQRFWGMSFGSLSADKKSVEKEPKLSRKEWS